MDAGIHRMEAINRTELVPGQIWFILTRRSANDKEQNCNVPARIGEFNALCCSAKS